MAKSIEELLRQIYVNADRDDILADADLFLRRLEAGYTEAYKTDCRLLEKAARAGVGSVVRQFLRLNRKPTDRESDRLCSQIMTQCGMTGDEARRTVYLYSAMVGWEAYRLPPRPVQKPAGKRKFQWYDIVGLLLLIQGVLGYIILYASAADSGMPVSLLDNLVDLGMMQGMSAGDMIVVALIRGRLFCLVAGALTMGIPRLVQSINKAKS